MPPGTYCCFIANGKIKLREVKRLVSVTQETVKMVKISIVCDIEIFP